MSRAGNKYKAKMEPKKSLQAVNIGRFLVLLRHRFIVAHSETFGGKQFYCQTSDDLEVKNEAAHYWEKCQQSQLYNINVSKQFFQATLALLVTLHYLYRFIVCLYRKMKSGDVFHDAP